MFMEDGIGELSKLPNIGKTVEEQLIKVGINTPDWIKNCRCEDSVAEDTGNNIQR